MITVICSNCGTEFKRWPSHVKLYKSHFCSRSCKHEYPQEVRYCRRPFEWTYNRLRQTCKQTCWALDLSYEEFLEFTQTTVCHYCDAAIPWAKHSTSGHNGCSYYLDRKDSFAGYSKDNCVVCCSRCNQSKSNTFSYEEWLEIGKVIKRFEKKRSATGRLRPQ